MSRVLFLTESFHPTLGGGETHIRRLGAALVAAGDAATVVTRRADASWPAEEWLDGLRVVRVGPPGPGRTGKYRMLPAALRAAQREAARHDVLVVRGTRVLGLPGLVAARARGRPAVLQPEINGELSGEAFTWGKSWQRGLLGSAVRDAVAARNALLRDADAFVAMSRLIRDEMRAAGVPGERIRLLPHGVDLERFRPAAPDERRALRQACGLPEGVLAVYSGRLLRGKGLETLVDAMGSPAVAGKLKLVAARLGRGPARRGARAPASGERARPRGERDLRGPRPERARTTCAPATCSCSRRSSRRSASRSWRPPPAGCRPSPRARGGSWT